MAGHCGIEQADSPWQRREWYSSSPSRPVPPRYGARSLIEMTMEVVADSIADIGAEYIGSLSAALAGNLRDVLQKRGPLSLHAWTLLSRYLLDPGYRRGMTSKAWRSCSNVPQLTSSLRVYTAPVCSPTFVFIVHLRILVSNHVPYGILSADKLMALASLPNLGVLEIFEAGAGSQARHVSTRRNGGRGNFRSGSSKDETDVDANAEPSHAAHSYQVSDRLLRGWSEQPDPFPNLRALRLWGSHDALTEACLPFVTRLPALAIFDVSLSDMGSWSKARGLSADLHWRGFTTNYLPGKYDFLRMVRMVETTLGTGTLDAMPASDADQDSCAYASDNAVDAAGYWAFGLFSFLLAQGYDNTSTGAVPGVPDTLQGCSVACVPFVTLSLGDDRFHTSYANRREQMGEIRNLTFVRTPESLAHRRRGGRLDMADAQAEVQGTPATANTKKRSGNSRQPRLKRRKGYTVGNLLGALSGE